MNHYMRPSRKMANFFELEQNHKRTFTNNISQFPQFVGSHMYDKPCARRGWLVKTWFEEQMDGYRLLLNFNFETKDELTSVRLDTRFIYIFHKDICEYMCTYISCVIYMLCR